MLDFSGINSYIDNAVKELENFDAPVYGFEPVGIQKWVESSHYLNLGGSPGSFGKLYSTWMDELIGIFGDEYTLYIPYDEIIYIACAGVGKSFVSSIIMSYLVYRDLVIKNFRHFIGLADRSTLAYLNTCITATQAKDIVFGEIVNRIETCPWFQKQYRKNPESNSKIEIEKLNNITNKWENTKHLIFPGSSSDKVPIGYSIRCGIIDEINYYQYTVESKRKGMREWDAAQEVYDNFLKRFRSRGNANFQKTSFLCAITTSRYKDSFAERKEEEALKDNRIRFKRFDVLTVKKELFQGEDFFKVDIETNQIVEQKDTIDFTAQTDTNGILKIAKKWKYVGNNVDDAIQYLVDFQSRLLKVPMRFFSDFQKDFIKNVREVLALPVKAISPFLTDKGILNANCNLAREHPITPDGKFKSWFVGDKNTRYFGHVDLSENRCATGFCISHWDVILNKVVLDLILQILANQQDVKYFGETVVFSFNNEIDVEAVESLIIEISKRGFNFGLITFDQFQSLHSRQSLQKFGLNVEKKSVIRDKSNFTNVKELLFRGQLDYYNYTPFMNELRSAEEDRDKVVAGAEGRIDTFEAVAGSVRNTLESLGGIISIPQPILASKVYGITDIKAKIVNPIQEEHIEEEYTVGNKVNANTSLLGEYGFKQRNKMKAANIVIPVAFSKSPSGFSNRQFSRGR